MNFWKPSAGLAIDLKHNIFLRARLTLTFFYVLAIGIIMGIFSLLLYYSLATNLYDSLQDKFPNKIEQRLVYAETTDNLQNDILTSDIVGIIIIMFLAYILSGKTLKPIRQALDDQKRFSADASHELRTPLAVIQSESEVLLREKNAPVSEYRHILQSTLEEVAKMKKITEELLIIARSEYTKAQLFEKINISEIVLAIIKNMQPIADAKQLSMTHTLQNSLFTSGDRILVQHAVINVLQNALDYTLPGGSISVNLGIKNNKILLVITDTGIGIAAKDIPHVFQRFYKSANSREYKQDATGLGLSIVDQIIKDHRGKISIESMINKGTTFTITLPLQAE
jgi:two-component system sensor histidine kinase CiaH